jgi:hypothetical protein
MAKTIEVDLQVNSNLDGSITQLRALKKELRNTAVGTEEFKKLFNEIDDLEDKIKSAKNVSSDWIDSLENAGGPIGMLGGALNKAKVATQSFGSALKATGIGLIAIAVGGLVAAFTESEVAMKKLEPLFIGLEKILGGIFRVMEPLLDIFIDLALKALPYVTKGIGIFYSSLFALFTFIKNAGMGAGQILKGIFTLDWNALQAGYNQLAGTWDATVKSFSDANKLFTDGSNEVTKTEKKNSDSRVKIRKGETKAKEKEVSAELKAMREYQGQYEEHLKKLAELQQQYNTEIEDLQAVTEQQKLDLWYKRKKDEIDAITQSEQEKNALYALLETQRGIKQAEIEKKQREEKEKTDKETEEKRLAKEKELRDKEISDQKIAYETKKELQLKYVSTVGSIGKLLQQSAGENKDMAIAGILLEQASAVASIAINTQKNAAKLGYLSPGGIAELAGGAIGITSAIIAAKQGISAINASGVKGGSGGGGGMSAPSINAPRFNVVGTNGTNQIAQSIGQQSNQPVKAYVVAKDVTTAQSLDRNIVSSASM